MCGIVGWVDWHKDLTREPTIVKDMNRTLAHRGPDAEGIWFSPRAAFGHRRLVVVDPEGGNQPMMRKVNGNNYIITYNGELYNSPELRKELIVKGYNLETRNSDTEVLLFSYIEWGKKCLEKLNGIYAFAIWDENKQTLFLARDRLGVKPLFYCYQDNAFIFASEPKALLAHPQIKAEIEAEGLAEILVMGPSRTPGHGVFKQIKELRPGYCLDYNRDGLKIEKYWTLRSRPHEDDLRETVLKVRNLLQDTVSRQLLADVPVCTLLSGGLDSSCITALASQKLKQEGEYFLRSFSVDYADNQEYFKSNQFEKGADYPWILRVSRYLNNEHQFIILENTELFNALTESMLAQDLPGMTDIDSSLYLFCREIKKQATVALSGECADEVFGGYPWFYNIEEQDYYGFPWIRQLEGRNKFLLPEIIKKIRPHEYAADRYQEAMSEVPYLPGENFFSKKMREMFYLNITRFMPTLLDRKDRMSMACGLEVRVPFSDHRLVEYVWNIPWEMKYYDNMPKGILRQAMKGLLPDDVLMRPKSPYPKTHNPIYYKAVKDEIFSILENPVAPIHVLIDGKVIKEFLSANRRIFTLPWFGQLMGDTQYLAYLIQINRWLEKYHISIKM